MKTVTIIGANAENLMNNNFASTLRQLRMLLNLNQKQFADIFGLSQSSISQLENGGQLSKDNRERFILVLNHFSKLEKFLA